MAFSRGDTFLYLGDAILETHLWFVVSYPDRDSENVVIANFTKEKLSTTDKSCQVKKGEHPWVVLPTVVEYRRSNVTRLADLEQLLKEGDCGKRQPLSPALLEKVTLGFSLSEDAKRACKKVLISQGLIPPTLATPATRN